MRNHVGKTLGCWRKLFLATGVVALAVPVVVAVLKAPSLWAQAPTSAGDRLTYAAVSIKPNKSGDQNGHITIQQLNLQTPGGRFTATNIPVRALLGIAYNLTVPQSVQMVSGAPAWIDSERFDIEAVPEGNPTVEQQRLMLQSLLADRFKLMIRHETHQGPVYALVAIKPGQTGPQLRPHSDDKQCPDPSAAPKPAPGMALSTPGCGCRGGNGVPGSCVNSPATGETMEMLAAFLSGFQNIDRPVLDRTGLAGAYDLTVVYTPVLRAITTGPNFNPDPLGLGLPEIFTAFQEQLGLKLEPQTGSFDVMVIDHVEEPSPN